MTLPVLKNKLYNGKQQSNYDEDALIDLHHLLMKEYGWIPLQEFINLPLPTIWNLFNCIKRDKEAEDREYKKARKK